MGGNGISLEHGVTVPDSAIAAVKMMAMRVSRRRILVGDSSKYGSDSFVRFAQLSDFERFITDDGLPVEQAAELHLRGWRSEVDHTTSSTLTRSPTRHLHRGTTRHPSVETRTGSAQRDTERPHSP